MTQLFAKYPDLPEFFDVPDATVQQRAACFELLAHCALRDTIYETFAGLYEQSPSLGEEERDVLTRTRNLIAGDAPAWVLETFKMAGLLPSRIFAALPEPLHRGGFTASDGEEIEAIRSAASKLSNLQEIQALSRKVLDQQLQRLKGRWSAQQPPVKDRLKGTEGLVRKTDLSRYSQYMDKLTDKQRQAFELKFAYGLKTPKIASRMGIHRKTADEHIKAAERKVEQARSSEKRKVRRAKNISDF